MLTKIIGFVKQYQTDLVLGLVVILVAVTSFNLGKFSVLKQQKPPLTIRGGDNIVRPLTGESGGVMAQVLPTPRPQTVVASKKSKSKLYHFSWCPGAGKIAAANKLSFANEAAAIAAGYSLAGNCSK